MLQKTYFYFNLKIYISLIKGKQKFSLTIKQIVSLVLLLREAFHYGVISFLYSFYSLT